MHFLANKKFIKHFKYLGFYFSFFNKKMRFSTYDKIFNPPLNIKIQDYSPVDQPKKKNFF